MISRVVVIQFSCVLSMIGSCFTMLTTIVPIENQRKTGKILLFWLCICDFLSSLVYFIQSFFHFTHNSALCKTTALLGIFFPISSFLWTDLIAYYLFTVIVFRHEYSVVAPGRNSGADPWLKYRLWYCHFFVWGTCLGTIALVAAFNQAGKQDEGTQWCWIRTTKPTETFFWELLGGKFIEWTSCFIVLPFLYTSAGLRLVQLDAADAMQAPGNRTSSVAGHSMNGNSSNRNSVATQGVSGYGGLFRASSVPDRTSQGDNSNISNEPGTGSRGSAFVMFPALTKFLESKFSAFYLKMAAVPIVFFIIRVWGTIRVWVSFSSHRQAGDHSWLAFMQDAFDPSQGFFNAILFVGFSRDGQRSIMLVAAIVFKFLSRYCWSGCGKFVPMFLRYSSDPSRHQSTLKKYYVDAAESNPSNCFEDENDLPFEPNSEIDSNGGIHAALLDQGSQDIPRSVDESVLDSEVYNPLDDTDAGRNSFMDGHSSNSMYSYIMTACIEEHEADGD